MGNEYHLLRLPRKGGEGVKLCFFHIAILASMIAIKQATKEDSFAWWLFWIIQGLIIIAGAYQYHDRHFVERKSIEKEKQP
jgi:hypothetical protein